MAGGGAYGTVVGIAHIIMTGAGVITKVSHLKRYHKIALMP
jgi:hypothetical protein